MNINEKIKEYDNLVFKAIGKLDYIPKKVEKEELVQIGRIALWKAIEDYKDDFDIALSTFVYSKVYQTIIDHLRKQQAVKRKDVVFDEPFTEDIGEEVIGNLLENEIKKIINNDINSQIFIDKYSHKLTYEEICKKYGMSMKQIRGVVEKVRKELKIKLKWEV